MRRHPALDPALGVDATGGGWVTGAGRAGLPPSRLVSPSLEIRRDSGGGRADGTTRAIRVLVVDDEPMVRTLLRLLFDRDERFEVVAEATDGHEALDAAARTRPDVVLLDLLMPRVTGHEALPAIRRAAPEAMVLILSSLSARDEEAAALADGAFAFLEKSALGPGLTAVVQEHLERFRAG